MAQNEEFNPAYYDCEEGYELHLPPPCYGEDLSVDNQRKFDALIVHLINVNLRRGSVPLRVARLISTFDVRSRSADKCHYIVSLKHPDPNFNYKDNARNVAISTDINLCKPPNVLSVTIAKRARETFGMPADGSDTGLLFTYRPRCHHNKSTCGQFFSVPTRKQLPHVIVEDEEEEEEDMEDQE